MTSTTTAAGIPGARRAPLPQFALRPYQAEAVDAIAAGLAEGGTGQLHAACGSGKTFIGQRAAERMLPPTGITAVLVPSLSLVAQTLASWQERTATGLHAALAVCSDDTVADAPAHLPDLGIPATTDPGEIAAWLDLPAPGPRLIVGTYRSADRLAEALRNWTSALDLLILDEAHHLAGRPDASTRRVVDPAWLPAARRLYMTATPRINAAAAALHGHLSMDDSIVFGEVLYSYPFSRAIAEGHLEDYRVLVVGIRDSDARALLADSDREYVEAVGAPSLQTVTAQAAMAKASALHGLRRVLSFHHRIEQGAEFARTLPSVAGRLGVPVPHAAHVHGEMDHRTRERILERLRTPAPGGWTVISNARCLSEGVDVPAVDGILFANPKRSAVDIVQAVGRALRRHPDTPGPSTIVVPIVVPEEDGEIGDLEAGDYATLWQVIRALRAHDEPLGIELDLQRMHDTTFSLDLPKKITVVLPDGTSQQLMDQLVLLTVRQTTSPWWEGYAAATAFREEHGHLRVPDAHVTAGGHALGAWINNARTHRKKGWMPADRAAALDRLGMDWSPQDTDFLTCLDRLREFRDRYGHLNVLQTHQEPDGYALGSRVNRLRGSYARGALPAERVAALEALRMVWNADDAKTEQTLAAAKAFREEHGHLRVPREHITADGHGLGRALYTWRGRHRRGLLPAEVVSRLEELGMVWNPKDDRWTAGLEACRRFRDREGHLRVPVSYRDPEGYNLGDFIAYYRALHTGSVRKGGRVQGLPAEREAVLEELGMVWRVEAPRRGATPEEIAMLRALPRARGGELTEAIGRLVVESGVEQKSIADGLGSTPGAVSGRVSSWRKHSSQR